jgi:flagellar biosynthetic protein FliR
MSLRFDIGWLLAVLLVSIRVTSGLTLAPVLGPASVPAPARVAIVLALSGLLVAALPVAPVSLDLTGLVAAAGAEALIGGSLAFGFLAAYAAVQLAGRILDVQMGYGAAAILNPAAQAPAPLIASLFGMVGVATFLAIDGHHVLIRALSASLEAFPPGRPDLALDWDVLFRQSGVMFTFGLALAGPVMIALLLADIGMAVIARSVPQLNVFILGFAVKALLGLGGLVASVAVGRRVLTSLFDSTFRYWDVITGGP